MSKETNIEYCEDCPHSFCCGNDISCGETDKIIEGNDPIPEWCPLPDSKIEWQPLETAPKDGTDIILRNGELCAVGHYDYGWYPSNITTSYDMARALLDFTPTHWMPPPSPPSEEEKQVVNLGHVTRFSDSSLYDEVCCNCGATDARGDDRLIKPCPHAREK